MKNLLGTYKATAHGVPPPSRKRVPQSSAQPNESQDRPSRQQFRKADDDDSAALEVRPPRQFSFEARSSCKFPLVFWLKFLDTDRKWQTKKWNIEPKDNLSLTTGGVPVTTENTVAYVGIELESGPEDYVAHMFEDDYRVEIIDGQPRKLWEVNPLIEFMQRFPRKYSLRLSCSPRVLRSEPEEDEFDDDEG